MFSVVWAESEVAVLLVRGSARLGFGGWALQMFKRGACKAQLHEKEMFLSMGSNGTRKARRWVFFSGCLRIVEYRSI